MKIIVVSGNKSIENKDDKTALNILKDLEESFSKENKKESLKHMHVDISGKTFLFGLPFSKEAIFPEADLIIDTSHHNIDDHYNYSVRLGVDNFFKKNMNRLSVKSLLYQLGLETNDHLFIKENPDQYSFSKSLFLPSIIKSVNYIVPTFIGYTHAEMLDYLKENLNKDKFIIENFIKSDFYTCVFIKNFRGKDIYSTSIFERVKSVNRYEYLVAKNIDSENQGEIIKTGENILSVVDSNILEISFLVKRNNVGAIENIYVNNVVFSPRYYPGTPFYEILKFHGINMLSLVNNFLDNKLNK